MLTSIGIKESFIEPIPVSGCWIWTGAANKDGYGVLQRGNKTQLAHRYIYSMVVGPLADNLVLHRCDTPSCVNPHHLFLGTANDNMQDMVRKGRNRPAKKYGSLHPAAKLTEADIPIIKKLSQSGLSQREIAVKFNVSQRTIWDIVHGRIWAL